MKGDYRDYLESRNLRQYLRQISKFPTLSRQEEKKMAELIQKGDKNALGKMIEANLKFVVSYVKKYRGMGMGLFDLINEGNLGLIEAAKRFDPERKVKFISYAVWWIRQAIIHALAQYSRAYYLPQRFSDKISEMKKKTIELKAELKREPTREEIAKKMGIDPEDVEELEMLGGREISLSDKYFDESKEEVGDRIKDNFAANTDDQIVKNSVQQRIRQMLGELDEKESLVLRLRFGMDDDTPQTLQEIGDKMKLTRERVRQIEKKAMRKLARSSKLQQLRGHLN
jgi:RNA polymerase primary sigma factor